jgi:hypothetical protein
MALDQDGNVAEAPEAPSAAAAPAAAAPAAVVPESEKFVSSVQPSEKETLADEPAVEEVTPGVAVAPYALAVPGDIPLSEHTESRTAWVEGFQTEAAKSGVPASVAQTMLEAAIDVAVGVPYSYDPDFTDAADAEANLTVAYGEEIAKSVATLAQRYSARMGPAFQSWLDSGPGNDVAVITALALAENGTLSVTPALAQQRINEAMTNPKSGYNSNDPKRHRLAVAEVQILSRIAHRDSAEVASSRPTPKAVEPMVQTGASTTATVRSEVNKMLGDSKHALNVASHPDHAKAVKRFHELTAKL